MESESTPLIKTLTEDLFLSIAQLRSRRKLVFEFFSIVFGCCRSEEFDTQSEDITTVVNILLRTVIQCVAKRSKVNFSNLKNMYPVEVGS